MKYKLILLLAVTFQIWSTSLSGQAVHTSTFEKVYDNVSQLEIDHRYGALNVHQSTDGKLSIKAVISAKGEKPDIDVFLSKIEIKEEQNLATLSLVTSAPTRKWVNNNGRIKVVFKDGTKVQNITDFKITYDVYAPLLELAVLKNKYHNINLESFTGNLDLYVYDADINGTNVEGDVIAETKYGGMKLQNIGDLELKAYESKVKIGQAKEVKIDHKYAEIEIENCADIEIKSYDGELNLGTIAGDLELTDKYSEIEIKECRNADLSIYDANLKLGKALQVKLTSKYTEYAIGQIEELQIEQNYEDKFEIDQVNDILSLTSKYTTFNVQKLNNSLELLSYTDVVYVKEVGADLSKIDTESKYTKYDIPLIDLPNIDLNISGRYVNMKMETDGLDIKEKGEKDNLYTLRASRGNGNLKVHMQGYESSYKFN